MSSSTPSKSPFLLSAILSVALSACGGGDDPPAPPPLYESTVPEVRGPVFGDLFEYRGTESGSYSDGSGATSFNGKVSVSVGQVGQLQYGSNEKPGYDYVRISVLAENGNGQVSSSSRNLAWSTLGYQLIQNEDGCYITEAEFDAGHAPIVLPRQMAVGVSYDTSYQMFCPDRNRLENGRYRLSVLAREIVSTTLGRFMAYKMSFSDQFRTYSDDGVLWVYPLIGVVKETSTFQDTSFFVFTSNAQFGVEDVNFDFQ